MWADRLRTVPETSRVLAEVRHIRLAGQGPAHGALEPERLHRLTCRVWVDTVSSRARIQADIVAASNKAS